MLLLTCEDYILHCLDGNGAGLDSSRVKGYNEIQLGMLPSFQEHVDDKEEEEEVEEEDEDEEDDYDEDNDDDDYDDDYDDDEQEEVLTKTHRSPPSEIALPDHFKLDLWGYPVRKKRI
jgi:hypothetical protein